MRWVLLFPKLTVPLFCALTASFMPVLVKVISLPRTVIELLSPSIRMLFTLSLAIATLLAFSPIVVVADTSTVCVLPSTVTVPILLALADRHGSATTSAAATAVRQNLPTGFFFFSGKGVRRYMAKFSLRLNQSFPEAMTCAAPGTAVSSRRPLIGINGHQIFTSV